MAFITYIDWNHYVFSPMLIWLFQNRPKFSLVMAMPLLGSC